MESQHKPHLNSCISPNSVKNMAESIGIINLDGSITNYISEDLSYKISILLQLCVLINNSSADKEAEKFSRHEKKRFLSTKDFSKALINKNMEPFYGFSDDAFIPFKHAYANNKEFYFNEEIDMDLTHIALAQLPKIPLDSSLKAHWLCIEGIQPMIPENIAPSVADAKKVGKSGTEPMPKIAIRSTQKRKFEDANHLPAHGKKDACAALYQEEDALSMEQQLYYRDITEACVGSEEIKRAQAFQSLATDPGLHQLLPRFTAFVSDGVKINVIQRNLAVLIYLMRMVRALLENPYLTDLLELYLHELVPAVLSCAMSRQICQRPEVDNHWALRDFAAKLLAQMCKHFGTAHNSIQSRTTALMSQVVDRFVPPPATKIQDITTSKTPGTTLIRGNVNGDSSGVPHSPSSPLQISEDYPPLVLPRTGSSGVNTTPTTTTLPSFATLYGAISGLGELGTSVARTLLGPRAKALAEVLKKRLEATPLNQNPGGGLGLRPNPQTQQQLIAERVAIEHVKQILARACAAIHKSHSSLAVASIVTMEELKEEYGPHLAPLVYTQIKKSKQQQPPPQGPPSTVSSSLNTLAQTSHREQYHHYQPSPGSSQSQFVSQQLNSQFHNAPQARLLTSQSPYSIPSQNRVSPFSHSTIANQTAAASALYNANLLHQQQQHQQNFPQRLQLAQHRLILNHNPPGPASAKTTTAFPSSHPPLNQFQSSVPYRIQHQSSVRQATNTAPSTPPPHLSSSAPFTTGSAKTFVNSLQQQQQHQHHYNNNVPPQATHTQSLGSSYASSTNVSLPGLVNRNGPAGGLALSLQGSALPDPLANSSSYSNTQNGAALARLSPSQQFHDRGGGDDDCIIVSPHPRPIIYPEPGAVQNYNGDLGGTHHYDPSRTKDGPDNSVLQKIPNYPHKYMPNLGTTPSNFR